MKEVATKTFKRETAVVLLLLWAGMGVFGAVAGDQYFIQVARDMGYPVMGFATAAFGIDAVGKQWKR